MNRAGQYITALGGIASYKAYKPNPLPPFPEVEMDAEMIAYIKEHPIISIGKAATALCLSFNGISGAVKKMVEVGILRETTTKARDRVFEYSGYIDILKSGT